MHQLQYLRFTTGHKTARGGQALVHILRSMQWPRAEPSWNFLTLRPFFQPLNLLVTINRDLSKCYQLENRGILKRKEGEAWSKLVSCTFRHLQVQTAVPWPIFCITVSKALMANTLKKHLHVHFPKSWLPMRQRPVYKGCNSLDLNLLSEVEAWCNIFPCNWGFSMPQFLWL